MCISLLTTEVRGLGELRALREARRARRRKRGSAREDRVQGVGSGWGIVDVSEILRYLSKGVQLWGEE
jgi:hypothetical protein